MRIPNLAPTDVYAVHRPYVPGERAHGRQSRDGLRAHKLLEALLVGSRVPAF